MSNVSLILLTVQVRPALFVHFLIEKACSVGDGIHANGANGALDYRVGLYRLQLFWRNGALRVLLKHEKVLCV